MNIPKKVPLLPGHQFSDPFKIRHYKIQQFNVIDGSMQEKTNYIEENINQTLMGSLKTGDPLTMQYGVLAKPQNDYIPRIQPKWLKYDRRVLAFTGYFKESVVENPDENYRIRQMIIYYYLNDGTIYIMEPRIENSGLPQGVFLNRQKVPKTMGKDDWYTWKDFNVGININFNTHIFRLVNCDQYTKDYLNDNGIAVNPSEKMPVDPFAVTITLKNMKIPPPDQKEYKEYCEKRLGGGHPNGGLAQFLGNDRHVLSFDIMWDDKSLEGDINFFTLNFYLADNTVDIKCVRVINSGKDPFPIYISRMKLPKVPILTHYPGMSLKKEEFYGPEDFICGKYVRIYSRDCLIYNCDPYTKAWYKKNLGVQQIAIPMKEEKQAKFSIKVPPYTGYGTEEDSLGSVYSLSHKPPRKNINKMFAEDQFILRFNCRLLSEIKDFNDKTFILSFYCGDDTIQVYETSERNSGIMKGKFLERSGYLDPATGKQYCEADMKIGGQVVIGTWKFQILRADRYTYRYMQRKPKSFPQADVRNVLAKLKHCASKFESAEKFMVDLLKHLDKNDKGVVSFENTASGFKGLGIPLTHHEVYTLVRAFETGKFDLNMEAFYNAMAAQFNMN